jgi:hypothetical protein
MSKAARGGGGSRSAGCEEGEALGDLDFLRLRVVLVVLVR